MSIKEFEVRDYLLSLDLTLEQSINIMKCIKPLGYDVERVKLLLDALSSHGYENTYKGITLGLSNIGFNVDVIEQKFDSFSDLDKKDQDEIKRKIDIYNRNLRVKQTVENNYENDEDVNRTFIDIMVRWEIEHLTKHLDLNKALEYSIYLSYRNRFVRYSEHEMIGDKNTDSLECLNYIKETVEPMIQKHIDEIRIDNNTLTSFSDIDELYRLKISDCINEFNKEVNEIELPYDSNDMFYSLLAVTCAKQAYENEHYLMAIDYLGWHESFEAILNKGEDLKDKFREFLTEKHKEIGSKGGNKKGENYSEPRQKALDYHDRFFNKKKENGKFIYSAEKASRKIIEHFDNIGESLGYEPRPLARHINAHRKKQFKD